MTKGPDAFRTISEASQALGVPQHVLRFWETRFAFIKPMKRAGGRRLYRPQDLAVLRGIKALLHDEGLTIRGVQKLYKDHGLARVIAAGDPAAAGAPGSALAEDARAAATRRAGGEGRTPSDAVRLRAVLAAVEAAKRRLDQALGA